MTVIIKGRAYTLTENTADLPALRADMIGRGFDGTIWNGVSVRTGRQRRDIHAMFWRSAKTGEFVLTAGV